MGKFDSAFRLSNSVPEAWISDLDGDGKEEVLFRYLPADNEAQGALIYYSRDGHEKWRYSPRLRIRSRSESFDPVFTVTAVAILPGSPGQPARIVAAVHQRPYYPGQVVLLSSRGEVLREYWHSGNISHLLLQDLDGDGRPEILAGGMSNSWNAATLLVLDLDDFGGASDESQHPDYQLLGFPPERVRARIIFGRSRINRELMRSNSVLRISPLPEGFRVELGEYAFSPRLGSAYYEFDRTLTLRGMDLTDSYAVLHQELTAKGLIHWPLAEREEEEELRKGLVYMKR
jgi:hypothetical protein